MLSNTDRQKLKEALHAAANTPEGAKARIMVGVENAFRSVPVDLASMAEGHAFYDVVERAGMKVDDVIKVLRMAYPQI